MSDIDSINKMSSEQLNKLMANQKTNSIPGTSFWGSSEFTDRYRPSTTTTSNTTSTPLSSYMGKTYYTTDTYSKTPTSQHERLLQAIYKAPATARGTKPVAEERDMTSCDTLISFDLGFGKPRQLPAASAPQTQQTRPTRQNPQGIPQQQQRPQSQPGPRRELVSSSTKSQMVAILFSGVSKLISTLVFNWARENKVPTELL